MFDLDAPFYRPIWIRLVIVITCFGWGGVEFMNGSPGFAALFLAIGGYSAYRFFVTFSPAPSDPPED